MTKETDSVRKEIIADLSSMVEEMIRYAETQEEWAEIGAIEERIVHLQSIGGNLS